MPPSSTKPAAVIFDMDGVLIDSFEWHFRSWQQLAVEIGRVCTREEFTAGFGRTSREVMCEQWSDMAFTDDLLRQLDARNSAIYQELIAEAFPAMPGARDLMQSLSRAGFKIAIGSSGPPANVQLTIDKLGVRDLVSASVTGNDVTRGKPHPEVFLKAAARIEVEPVRCAVIEDAPAGIRAARAAGMRAIGFASTGRTRDILHEAHLLIDSLDELTPAAIRQLIDSAPADRPRGQDPHSNN